MVALDPIYQNLPNEYNCSNCNNTINSPMCCGHPMHLEEHEKTIKWICWMGSTCGIKDATCGIKNADICNQTEITIYPTVNSPIQPLIASAASHATFCTGS